MSRRQALANMSTIYKYINREVLKYYGIVLAMVVGIYGVVDFLEKIVQTPSYAHAMILLSMSMRK